MNRTLFHVVVAGLAGGLALPAAAATITFDTLVTGQTSFGFDGDGDGIADAVFTTTDPTGFNTIGPGLAQFYIQEPGLEGTTLLNPDLRVNFTFGATGPISFGFALSTVTPAAANFASLRVFDSSNTQIGFAEVAGQRFNLPGGGQSTFVEGVVNVAFSGTAAYGLFNFSGEGSRYIIDNFNGNFGSVVPEPASALLLALGLGALLVRRARSR